MNNSAQPAWRSFLARLVPVQPDEWARVVPVLAASFLLVAGVTIGRNVRDSLFLKNFGIANLPYMYVASPLLVIACSSLYSRFVARLDRVRFIAVSFAVYAGVLVLAVPSLATGARWLYPALYMVVQAFWILSIMQFWTAARDLFDTREAKRLFPLLASGGLLGMISTGFIIRPAVRLLGTPALLTLWAGCLAVAAWLLARSLARSATQPSRPSKKKPAKVSFTADLLEGFRLAKSSWLLRAMSGVTLALWVVFVLVDFQFNRVMNATYPTQDALTAFLGAFRAWAGLAALVVQVLLTPQLVSRLGVGRTILFHPAAMVVFTAGLLAWYGYATAFAAKLFDHILLWSLQDASFQLLYNPLSPERRVRASPFIEGSLKPIANGTGGMLLIFAAAGQWPPWVASAAALVFATAWLLFARKIGPAYLEALLAELAGQHPQGRVDPRSVLARMHDRESLERLFTAIRTATPAQALLTVHLLERLGGARTGNLLQQLLTHPDPKIRATAAAALGRAENNALLDLLPQIAADSDPRVRANALEGLDPEKRAQAEDLLVRWTHDKNRRVRANAIRLLGRMKQAEGGEAASAALRNLAGLCREMCADSDRATRQAGAFAAAGLPTELAQPLLLEQLSELSNAPWRQELRSLAEVGDELALEAVLNAASRRDATHEAFRAVRHIHARRAAPVLARMVEIAGVMNNGKAAAEAGQGVAPVDDGAVKISAVRALGRMNDAGALPVLAGMLRSNGGKAAAASGFGNTTAGTDGVLRLQTLRAMNRLAERHPLPPAVVEAVRGAVHEEAGRLANVVGWTRSLAAQVPEHAPLVQPLLADEAARIQARLFLALGIITDRHRMAAVAHELQPGGGRRQRANALEALEFLAGQPLGRHLVALLEGEGAATSPLDDVLAALEKHPSPTIRAATALLIGRAGLTRCAWMLGFGHTAEFVVRQAVLDSLYRLRGPAAAHLLEEARADAHPAVRDRAAALLAPADVEDRPMLLTIEKILFLKSVPLFASLDGDDLVMLSEICSEQEVPSGGVVFHEDDEGNDLYIVVNGRVRVFRGKAAGERLLAEIGERECFGEMALIDSEVRSATVMTTEPSRFLKIRGDDFRELLLDYPKISFAILRLLSQRLRKADELPVAVVAHAGSQEYM